MLPAWEQPCAKCLLHRCQPHVPRAPPRQPQGDPKQDVQAKALRQLRHPNICAVMGAYNKNGVITIVMELLEGQPLLDHIVELGAYSEAQSRDTAKTPSTRHTPQKRTLPPAASMRSRSSARLGL